MNGIQNIGGFNINFDAIAAGWLRILQDSVPQEDYACLRFGMIPTDLFKGLVENLEMKLAKECLVSAGYENPSLEKMAETRKMFSSGLLTRIENALAVAVITAATEAGICSV